MTKETIYFNGKRLTSAELENNANKVEEELEVVNKHLIKHMFKVLNSIMNILKRKEDGIFSVLIKWFRLYSKLYNIIDPNDEKLLKFYESTVPTIITYIIGCLQYKPKEVINYHYNLLEILEELIKSLNPTVLKRITKFEKETIGCLWNPIELAGDFNTQLKALNLFVLLLKQFDENRQNEELNSIKWTNLNFFQEKLKAIVQATTLSHILENHSRELLNNYNMNLSKTLLVYSFYCTAATYGKKYEFYKLLNFEKFWIDINYSPKTLSFSARFKLNSKSKYEIINVTLKIRKITLKNNILQVFCNKPGDFSHYSDYFSSVTVNVVEFTLSEEEKQRLINNNFVIEYFNNLSESNGRKSTKIDQKTSDLLKNASLKENNMEKSCNNNGTKHFKNVKNCQINSTLKENISSPLIGLKRKKIDQSPQDSLSFNSNLFDGLKRKSNDVSPKVSINVATEVEKRPIRSVRNKNKFFKSFLMEDSLKDYEDEKPKRKRPQKRRSRQSKSCYKQVCKVTPTVDLTKTENTQPLAQNDIHTNESIIETSFINNASKTNLPLFNTQYCNEILRQVADIYDVGDTTYAKPCQSYRNFQIQMNPDQKPNITKDTASGRKKKIHLESPKRVEKKIKLNCNTQKNEENLNPETNNMASTPRPFSRTKSPHLFGTQGSDEIQHFDKLKADINVQNFLNSSSECEEARGSNEKDLNDIEHICTPERIILSSSSSSLTTPRPTSAMNISNISDSDMEITQINNFQGQKNQQLLKTSSIMPQNAMKLVPLSNNSNITLEQQSKSPKENAVKNNYEDLQQQMLNGLEDNSDSELDSNYLAPIKETMSDLMAKYKSDIDDSYQRNCTIFKNRLEETSSSDEDDKYGETGASNSNDKIVCKITKPLNNEMEIVKPITFNKIFCQAKDLCTKQDNGFEISSNLTTTTKCQVTPTAIIMHKIQISAQKSIIHRRGKYKMESRANKCLNDFFENKNKKSIQFQSDNLTVECQNLNTLNEIKSTLAHNKESVEMQEGNAILKDDKNCEGQQSSSTNLNVYEDSENNALHHSEFNIKHQARTLGHFNNSFKNDLFQIINDYNTNTNQRLDSIIRQGVKKISDRYTQHFIDITKGILRKAEDNKMDLEKIRISIGKLVRELEWQYDAFINKSKELDMEMCKRVLENMRTTDVPNFIAKDYEDIFKKIHAEQNFIFQNVLQNIEKKKI